MIKERRIIVLFTFVLNSIH